MAKKGKTGKSADYRTMEEYREKQRKINRGAKIMALILVVAMVVFYVISAGLFLWD